MRDILREHARLIILRTLAAEHNASMNSAMLQEHLESYGITKPRTWVHAEMAWLADMGAVTVKDAGTVRVATLTEIGLRHVERKTLIEGIKPPSLAGA